MPHRAGLDHKAVVQAAAELIDTVGVEQLTLAQLAAHLGIRTPSLYNHIAGLAGLRRDLALYCTQELLSRFSRVAIGKSQDEAIIAIANAYRAFAKDHPGCYSFTIRPADPGDLELHAVGQEVVDVIQRVLAGYGLHNEDALHAVRGLRSIVHGFVSLEMAGGFGLPLDLDESFHRLVKVFIEGLRSEQPQ
jgi:AcrR family transcriptional regulator